MDEGPNPRKNEEPGPWLGHFSSSGWKNSQPEAYPERRVEML
jgi:hypothetical protein